MKVPVLGMNIGYYVTDEELNKRINNGQSVAPAIVCTVWDNEYPNNKELTVGVNCRVFLDGETILWKTSIEYGHEKGKFYFIEN